MKNTFIVLVILSIAILSCHQPEENCVPPESLILRIDSLETRIQSLESDLRPRLSVLMNMMQIHQARMWEPGISGNWPLLSYELKETGESLNDISKIYGSTPHGTTTIGQELKKLNVTLDSLRNAVDLKSKDEFVKNYNTLILKCNNCHKASGLDFYEILKPSKPAYSGDLQ